GVNKFISPGDEPYQPLRVDPSIERDQAERLARLRAARDAGQWQRRIDDLRKAAAGSQNVLVPPRAAPPARAPGGRDGDGPREGGGGRARPRQTHRPWAGGLGGGGWCPSFAPAVTIAQLQRIIYRARYDTDLRRNASRQSPGRKDGGHSAQC